MAVGRKHIIIIMDEGVCGRTVICQHQSELVKTITSIIASAGLILLQLMF